MMPTCGSGATVPELADLQTAIDVTTSQAQKLEDLIKVRQKNIETLHKNTKACLTQVRANSSRIKTLINHLYHIRNFSPLLTILASRNVEDLVHLNLALTSISPLASKDFKEHLELLQKLASGRLQLKKERVELENLEKEKKKTFSTLEKQSSELDELLQDTDQKLPLPHFDSKTQLQEHIDRLTINVNDCQKIVHLPEGLSTDIVLTPSSALQDARLYPNLKDQIVRCPFDGEVLLAGNNAEMGGVVLIRWGEYYMLIKGIDKILRYPGTMVKEQQSLGIIFNEVDRPKEIVATLWQCKPKSQG